MPQEFFIVMHNPVIEEGGILVNEVFTSLEEAREEAGIQLMNEWRDDGISDIDRYIYKVVPALHFRSVLQSPKIIEEYLKEPQ